MMTRYLTHMLVAGCILYLAGCVTAPRPAPVSTDTQASAPEGHVLDGSAARQDLVVAQRMVRAGDYSLVIPRLQRIATNYPDTQSGAEARYFLGLAYYQIGGYREALLYFNEYLTSMPEGKYVVLAREYLTSIAGEMQEGVVTEDVIQKQIESIEEKADGDPAKFADELELADLYWKAGHYQKAGALYIALIQQWPQLETDATIRTRIERGPKGDFIILSPEEVARRYAEEEPLLVVNTHSYRSGKASTWQKATGHDTNYHVSGQVVNRGNDTLRNVQVVVTIYGFGSLIYDVKTVNVGRLRAGETRAFSVRFTNFDNIENVFRYECEGTFER